MFTCNICKSQKYLYICICVFHSIRFKVNKVGVRRDPFFLCQKINILVAILDCFDLHFGLQKKIGCFSPNNTILFSPLKSAQKNSIQKG
ncbi:hypothetical protein EZS27_015403 [termite gut metagenome]|uniref:Uncharacterized protein n=1 Tax=termite gut metagenome TaxID=433724 RepID=A0A5J4RRS1_9ZZZZ